MSTEYEDVNEIGEVELQWGGRFASEPDRALLAFGSSLRDDLAIAPFDVRVLAGARRGARGRRRDLRRRRGGAARRAANASRTRSRPARSRRGRSSATSRTCTARSTRAFARSPGAAGDRLHSGRSRNDQVATTMLLFARERALPPARARVSTPPRCARSRRRRTRTRHAGRGDDALAARAADAARAVDRRGRARLRARGRTLRARRRRRGALVAARQRRARRLVAAARP